MLARVAVSAGSSMVLCLLLMWKVLAVVLVPLMNLPVARLAALPVVVVVLLVD
jgi:hypothetical protein